MEQKLANPNFAQKVPPQVLQEHHRRREDWLEKLAHVKSALEAKEVKTHSAEMGYMPNMTVPVADKDDARKILKLIDLLEDHDDVQSVYANYEIPDAWIEELQG